MIKSLSISNYALIDALEIEFTPGLNIITGETGAGKSIMLGALSLLLGARADQRAVRKADRKSVVEASFAVAGQANAARWAADNGLDWDANECIIRREISPGGRSRSFVNDTPASLAQLAELGAMLIDIHSQNQNQLLATPAYQLKVIDSIAGNAALLEKYQKEYAAWRAAVGEVEEAERELKRIKDDEEYTRFRLSQLEDAQLTPGEQEELEGERELLANMTQIKQTLADALESLSEGDSPALSQLADAVSATEELAEVLEGASELAARLESARVEIQDIAETLADYDANLAANPAELEEIESRLSQIYSLQSRFKVDSVERLINIRNGLRERLQTLDDGDNTLLELQEAANQAHLRADQTARELTKRRQAAAKKFEKELLATARPLGLPNLSCEVAVEPLGELLPSGSDRVEFRVAFNKNQAPMAVGGAASGGEVSRLMLSIKSIVTGRLQLPSIVFDEVDTGVSGDVANRMGRMMQRISADLQVLTITHLPQVAAMGESHFKVFKEDDAEATHTRIRRLSEPERLGELALMLSGSTTDPAALANAQSLIDNSRNGKD